MAQGWSTWKAADRHQTQKRPHTNQGIGALLLDLLKQLKVHRNVAAQQLYLSASLFDQTAKFTN